MPLFIEETQVVFLLPKNIKVSQMAVEDSMVTVVIPEVPSTLLSTLISARKARKVLKGLASIMRLNIGESLAP